MSAASTKFQPLNGRCLLFDFDGRLVGKYDEEAGEGMFAHTFFRDAPNEKPTLQSVPFDWNEPMAQLAQEDFDACRDKLSYCAAQSIGMALAKLNLLEEQGAKVMEE